MLLFFDNADTFLCVFVCVGMAVRPSVYSHLPTRREVKRAY